MGYTEDNAMVRVDFYKPSGKWYTTEAIAWGTWSKNDMSVKDAFKEALRTHLDNRLSDMIAVCADPYHELAHPQMLMPGQWIELCGRTDEHTHTSPDGTKGVFGTGLQSCVHIAEPPSD